MRYDLILLRDNDLVNLKCPVRGPQNGPTICIARWQGAEKIVVSRDSASERINFLTGKYEDTILTVPISADVLIAITHGTQRCNELGTLELPGGRSVRLASNESSEFVEVGGLRIVIARNWGTQLLNDTCLSARVMNGEWEALKEAIAMARGIRLPLERWFPGGARAEDAKGGIDRQAGPPVPLACWSCAHARDLLWIFGCEPTRAESESKAFVSAGGKINHRYEYDGFSATFILPSSELPGGEGADQYVIMQHGSREEEASANGVLEALNYSSADRRYMDMINELNVAATQESRGAVGSVVLCAWKWFDIYRGGVERNTIGVFVHRLVGPWLSLCAEAEALTDSAAEMDLRAVEARLAELKDEWLRTPSAGPVGTLAETRRRVLGKKERRTVAPRELEERQRLFRARGQTSWDDDIFNTGIYAALQRPATDRATSNPERGQEETDALGKIWCLLGVNVEIQSTVEGGLTVSWEEQKDSWIEVYTKLFFNLAMGALLAFDWIESCAGELSQSPPDLLAAAANKRVSAQRFGALRAWANELALALEPSAARPERNEGGA